MAYSSDEGEIPENGAENLKATSSLPRTVAEGHGVDRRDRNRSRGSTPDHDTASRYSASSSRRSRSPRGYKRPRDERDTQGARGGSINGSRNRDYSHRYSHPAYDDRRRDNHYQRSRVSYEDLDHPPARESQYGYDGRDRGRGRDRSRESDRSRDRPGRNRDDREHDRYADKRPRHRSRSPPPNRSRRDDRNGRFDRFVKASEPDRRPGYNGHLRYDDERPPRDREGPSSRTSVGEAARTSKGDAKFDKGLPSRGDRSHGDGTTTHE